MKINIDDAQYKVNKTTLGDNEYQYNVTPKKRNCKLCSKSFENNNNGLICWTDDNGFYRSGYFCREHFVLIKTALKEISKQ